jgi:membrane protease YdiL (CAAX protease family)
VALDGFPLRARARTTLTARAIFCFKVNQMGQAGLILRSLLICTLIYMSVLDIRRRIKQGRFRKIQITSLNAIDFSAGLTIGIISIMCFLGLGYTFSQVRGIDYNGFYKSALVYSLSLGASAFFEEFLFRIILLQTLLRHMKSWSAILISSLLFGLMHTGNPNVTSVALMSHFLGGIIYAIALTKTGTIWLSLGTHFSWNFIQGVILGFPISGFNYISLLNCRCTTLHPTIMGGSYGPEAGLLGLVARFIAAVTLLIYLTIRKNGANFLKSGQTLGKANS